MTKPTIIIRQATIDDNQRLTEFRISQYKTAKEFELIKPELLSKQSGCIFIVEHEGIIVSTMQLEILTNQDYFSQGFFSALSISGKQISDKLSTSTLPSIYLSKAATVKHFRNSGLNSYIRLICLNTAISSNINSLTGVAFENAPRINLLEFIGYKFLEIEMSRFDYVRPFGKTYLLILSRYAFKDAKEKLELEVEELKENNIIINQTEKVF